MKTITVELRPWQQVLFGVAAVSWVVQTWGGMKVVNAHTQVEDAYNRMSYLAMYHLVKLVEGGVEIDEYDKLIMANPPKLRDADNPNLFEEFLNQCDEHGYSEDIAREFLMKLKAIREGENE